MTSEGPNSLTLEPIDGAGSPAMMDLDLSGGLEGGSHAEPAIPARPPEHPTVLMPETPQQHRQRLMSLQRALEDSGRQRTPAPQEAAHSPLPDPSEPPAHTPAAISRDVLRKASTAAAAGAMRQHAASGSAAKPAFAASGHAAASASAKPRGSSATTVATAASTPGASTAAGGASPAIKLSARPASLLAATRVWWSARAAREQRTLAVCAWMLAMGGVVYVVEPAWHALKQAQARSAKQQTDSASQQKTLVDARAAADARVQQQQRDIQGVVERRARAKLAVDSAGGALMQAEQIVSLMGSLVQQRPKLRLLELRTLASVPLAAPAAAPAASPAASAASKPAAGDKKAAVAAAAPLAAELAKLPWAAPAAPQLYEHPIEIAVQGSYAALSEFTASLRSIDLPVVWDAVHLHVAEHPVSVLKLRLHIVTRNSHLLPSTR